MEDASVVVKISLMDTNALVLPIICSIPTGKTARVSHRLTSLLVIIFSIRYYLLGVKNCNSDDNSVYPVDNTVMCLSHPKGIKCAIDCRNGLDMKLRPPGNFQFFCAHRNSCDKSDDDAD